MTAGGDFCVGQFRNFRRALRGPRVTQSGGCFCRSLLKLRAKGQLGTHFQIWWIRNFPLACSGPFLSCSRSLEQAGTQPVYVFLSFFFLWLEFFPSLSLFFRPRYWSCYWSCWSESIAQSVCFHQSFVASLALALAHSLDERSPSFVAGAKSLEKYLSSSAASLPTFSHLPTTSHKVVQVSISSAVSQPSRASCFLMVKTITTHPSAPLSDAVSSPSVARPTGMVHACTSQFLNHSRGSYFATYVHEDHSIASLAIDDLLFAIFDRLILHRTDDR